MTNLISKHKLQKHLLALIAALTLPAIAFAQEAAVPATAPAETAAESAATLEQKLGELDQRQRVVERKLEIAEEATAEKAKTGTKTDANAEGYKIKSADGAYQLGWKLLLHADGRFFLQDKDLPLTNQFLIRRARPGLSGKLPAGIEFRFTPEFGENKAQVLDAYVDFKPATYFGVRIGKFKEPMGLERLQATEDLIVGEDGLATQLTPNRDIGAQIFGEFSGGLISYAAGIFNGVVDGASSDGDGTDEKDISARLFSQPFVTTENDALRGFGFGAGGTLGSQNGSFSQKKVFAPVQNTATYKTSFGQQSIFSYRLDEISYGKTAVAAGKIRRVSPQGYYYYGPAGVYGEYVVSSQDVKLKNKISSIQNRAWQVGASVVVTGQDNSRKGADVKKPFDPAAGEYGAVEIAARFGKLTIDPEAFKAVGSVANIEKSVSEATEIVGGINWYLSKSAKIVADYATTQFTGGAAKKKAGPVQDRPDEKVLLARVQLSF